MQQKGEIARGAEAAAGLGFVAGVALSTCENGWLVLSHELSFGSGLDRVLFGVGATALEAALVSAASALLAVGLGAWALRRGAACPLRAIVWPAVLLAACARVVPWIDAALAGSWTRREQLGIDAALVAVATALALGLHGRLRGAADPRPAAWPSARALARVPAAFGVAALAAGLALLLPVEPDPPRAVGTSRPSDTPDSAAAALRLPIGTPVILLLVDTLRADHLSYAGYARETTPTLDGLARSGVVFEQAIAQATRTSPSMASLLTSTGPMTHGLIRTQSRLDESLLTWAEILQNEGYATGAVLANPNVGHHFQFTQGIETTDELFDEPEHDARAAFSRGLDWLREHRSAASFLWLHLVDPHSPYAAPGTSADRFRGDAFHRAASSDPLPLTAGRFGGVFPEARLPGAHSLADYVARYDSEIRFFDDELADFLVQLEALDLPREPLIVFTSDHGESLGEHDYYFSHGSFAFEPTAHVPLFLHHSALPAGLRVRQMVRSIDVLPTVLELLGIPVPDGIEGRSLVPLLQGDRLPEEPSIIFAGEEDLLEIAVRLDGYKLVASAVDAGLMNDWTRLKLGLWPNERRSSPLRGPRYRIALYDLQTDPGETVDISDREPDLRAQLLAYLRAHTASGIADFEERMLSEHEMPEKTQSQLRALGYIQ